MTDINNDERILREAFGITESGILFQFDRYTIAPGIEGARQILLPWEKLHGVLRADSPVASFLSNAKMK